MKHIEQIILYVYFSLGNNDIHLFELICVMWQQQKLSIAAGCYQMDVTGSVWITLDTVSYLQREVSASYIQLGQYNWLAHINDNKVFIKNEAKCLCTQFFPLPV